MFRPNMIENASYYACGVFVWRFVCGVFNVLAWTDTINFPPNNDLKKKKVYFIEHLLFQWFIRDKKFNVYFATWATLV